MKFFLANRQIKEIENGKRLRLAVPATLHELRDDNQALAWAKSVIDAPPDVIRAAWVEDLPVNPRLRAPGTLGEMLGTIARGEQSTGELYVWITCVVVELYDRDRPRGTYPIKWVGSVDTGMHILPPPKE